MGTSTRNRSHQTNTPNARGRLIHRRCRSAQDPPTTSSPVLTMDQGWHHQGFSDQNGGCSDGDCSDGDCSDGSAEGFEFTGGLHGSEFVVATDR